MQKTSRRTPVRGGNASPRESWRMWVITVLALAFASLALSMLVQRNDVLTDLVTTLRAEADQDTDAVPSDDDGLGDEQEIELIQLPLTYSIANVPAIASVSSEPFVITGRQLFSNAEECGVIKSESYFDDVASKFNGEEKTVYRFSYTEPTQDGDYYISILPNVMHYESLALLKEDFDMCFAGGSMYPAHVTTDWLYFSNACGSGYDDGSGRPSGCEEMRKAIGPTLTFY